MMSKESDRRVLIVGGGLGGLSAAIHLRLAGYEVTVYEANERVGGRANRIVRDGFSFDTGPSLLNYPWVFEELFAAANRKLSDYVELLPVDPSITFQWTDGTRFALSSDFRLSLAECERLETGCRPAVFAFLRDAERKYRMTFDKLVTRNEDNPWRWFAALSPREAWRTSLWRSFDSELARYFKSRYIREALGSYAMYLGGSPYQLPGMFTILPYGEMAFGLWLPKGGIYALVTGIERLALELGVEIQTHRRVRKIIAAGGRVKGLEFEDGEFQASALVVSNVDVPTTNAELLATDGNRRRDGAHRSGETDAARTAGQQQRRRRAAKTRMTPGVLTFYWGVRGTVPRLGHHTIFLPDDSRAAFADLFERKRLPRQLPFYVSVPSATDPALAPAGDTCLFILVPTPLISELPDIDWQEATHKIRTQVLATLAQHGVEIAPAQIRTEEVYTPEDWRRRFGLYDGSAFGAAHNLFQIGPFRAKNFSTETKGLYYAGASTTPGTGMPMVVLGGKLTAERILSHVR